MSCDLGGVSMDISDYGYIVVEDQDILLTWISDWIGII